ncbi:thioredoxin family protein [Planococcus kocurii]|uniref:thioredoxin family protein n=1 Tax=Caryophanaceae TaxID=186818 RepID=UPI000C7CFF0A|nr:MULTISPECIES: thioredoxin family protein [Planococcaceae]KAA0956154.1 glutaredoxin [Planococcus sp. ANT_H30]PKH09198.1 glutaredoxin [Planomicrobium sp. MB-3u-38]
MAKRRVEIFTAGCYLCDDTVQQVNDLACDNCEVTVYDLNKGCETNECREKAKAYGVQTVPAVAVNGELVDCCKDTGIDMDSLKKAGVGKSDS